MCTVVVDELVQFQHLRKVQVFLPLSHRNVYTLLSKLQFIKPRVHIFLDANFSIHSLRNKSLREPAIHGVPPI